MVFRICSFTSRPLYKYLNPLLLKPEIWEPFFSSLLVTTTAYLYSAIWTFFLDSISFISSYPSFPLHPSSFPRIVKKNLKDIWWPKQLFLHSFSVFIVCFTSWFLYHGLHIIYCLTWLKTPREMADSRIGVYLFISLLCFYSLGSNLG